MKTKLLSVLIAMVLVALSGCGKPAAMAQSKEARVTSPDVPGADLSELVAGNSAFAFDLYQGLREGEGNLFYSPYSLSVGLVMAYAGARGETEQQMAKTLHFTLPQDRLHPAFNALDLKLPRRGEAVEGEEEEGFRLYIVSSVWAERSSDASTSAAFVPEFLDVLAQNYGAGVRFLKARAPAESRSVVNEWFSEQTGGKIEKLIAVGSITAQTVMFLADVVYFKAAWLHPFDQAQTHDGAFSTLEGGQTTVPMMEQTGQSGYAQGQGYQVVELSYEGEEMSMVILLPEAGEFEDFSNALDAEKVASILSDIESKTVHLTMPKFSCESFFRLKETLTAMGMLAAFGDADFSGIDGTHSLYMDDVYHRAFVSVDEAGTEAAAATAVEVVVGAAPSPIEVTVDRPFVFLIRHIETGAILFVGRFVDPGA